MAARQKRGNREHDSHHRKFPHFHRERRAKVSHGLSDLKLAVFRFNEKHLKVLEEVTTIFIIVAVFLLLFIIIVEEGNWIYTQLSKINIKLDFLNNWYDIGVAYQNEVVIVENIIILFFIIDLYFQFFKRKSSVEFLKTYFIDLIAILPFSWFFEETRLILGAREGQEIAHIAVGGQVAESTLQTLAKEEAVSVRLAKLSKFEKFTVRLARFLRVSRIRHEIKKKK